MVSTNPESLGPRSFSGRSRRNSSVTIIIILILIHILHRYDAASHLSGCNHVLYCGSSRTARRLHVDGKSLCGFTEAELSHTGECPGCPAAADDHHGCLCLQTAVSTVKLKTKTQRHKPGLRRTP